MKSELIRDPVFRRVATNVKPDAKKRIVISKVPVSEAVTYHVYCNESGQIVLDPQVSVPAAEVWLYKNPEARAAVAAGLREAAEGRVTRLNLDDL
jgi:hypothetical protein